MLFRLSLVFGVSADTLRESLTAEEIEEYLAYYQLEPFGCQAEDNRCALLGYVVNRSAGGKSDFKDFLPSWQKPEPVPYKRWAEQFAAYAISHNSRQKPNASTK